jgi:hypothetical protein
MAYTTINKSTDYFNTKLYSGNATARSITGVGFQPDFTWIKNRSYTHNHVLSDAVRGSNKGLNSDTNNAEVTDSSNGYVTGFVSDGFSISNSDYGWVNNSSSNYASWNWKAGNSAGSANTDGDINSTVSVNTTAGFSIVAYTGNGVSNSGVGHGLGVKPSVVIIKSRSTSSTDWIVYTDVIDGSYDFLKLNKTDAKGDSGASGGFTSTKFHISGTDTNTNYSNQIAYCFAEKTGYSKFGTYEGNNNADGTFVYTGFKPAWILAKAASGSQTPQNQSWVIWDNKRSSSGGFNENSYKLYPNATDAEATSGIAQVDILSNGFKFRNSTHQSNSTNTYLYMAFAEAPIVGTNNIPATAR